MSEPLPLTLHHVSKTLAGRPVLRDVSFDCPAGTITALLGPNGAGKTTTVGIATGLRRADGGLVRVAGRDVTDARTRRHFSLVPQDIGFPDSLGVATCLDLVERQRPPSPFSHGRAALCSALGVDAVERRRVGALSGGQRRRLAIVLGMMRAPELLIMDEATTNLDEAARMVTWHLVREFALNGGAALVTTHILADVDTYADRVVALADGRVVLAAPVSEARDRLGGSEVRVRLDPDLAADVIGAMAARGHHAPTVVGSDELWWRTRRPLALTAALHDLAPDAFDLQVHPVPLAELLDTVHLRPGGIR